MPPKTNTERELLATARTIARLQRRQATLKRELKLTAQHLRVEKRHLRAITTELSNRRPDVAPLRAFDGAVGFVAHPELDAAVAKGK